jgi:glycine cleavage system transcriptional repressor
MTTHANDSDRWVMLTLVGTDRPGIVARLSGALYDAGCNLGDTSMARLGGNFAVMLMVEGVESGRLEQLLRPVVEDFGLRLHVDPIEGALHAQQEANVQVTVYGADRPGIVAQVTGALFRAGFNILDLNSDVGGTADQPVYVMILNGVAEGGSAAIERALAPVRVGGIEVCITPLEPLVA